LEEGLREPGKHDTIANAKMRRSNPGPKLGARKITLAIITTFRIAAPVPGRKSDLGHRHAINTAARQPAACTET